MFNIEFYSTADGTSELWDFLDGLQQKKRQKQGCTDTAQADPHVYPAA